MRVELCTLHAFPDKLCLTSRVNANEYVYDFAIAPFITCTFCSIQPWLQAEEVKSETPQQNLQSVDDRAKLGGQSD